MYYLDIAILTEYQVVHVDEYIDDLLREERVCDVIMPRIQKRMVLEETNQLEPRASALDDDLEEMETDEEDDDRETKVRANSIYSLKYTQYHILNNTTLYELRDTRLNELFRSLYMCPVYRIDIYMLHYFQMDTGRVISPERKPGGTVRDWDKPRRSPSPRFRRSRSRSPGHRR